MKNKTFILILARGGSKRIQRKALQSIGDTTLLGNAIKIGKECDLPVCVSSEDHEILKISSQSGASTILRPMDLASDKATSVDAAIHACNIRSEYETLILLQVTNPFVESTDIIRAYVKHLSECKSVFAAIRFSRALWAWDAQQPLFPHFQGVRSQDLAPVFLPAGAFFISNVKTLKETKSFFKPEAIPFEISEDKNIDIDTEFDLELARYLWHQRQLRLHTQGQ